MRCAAVVCLMFALAGFAAAQDTNFAEGPQYLVTAPFPEFLHPISTPSLSLNAPLPPLPSPIQTGPLVTNQPYMANPVLENQPDLFPIYYGYPQIPVIELAETEQTPELPASITGAGGVVDAESLRHFGYGVPLGDTAAYWKAHKPHAPRVYTNADIQRLRPS